MKYYQRFGSLAFLAFAVTLMLSPLSALAVSQTLNVTSEESALKAGGNQAKAAVERLKTASNQRNHQATRLLGDAYRTGKGINKDLEAAFHLYTEAARAGDSVAQYRMGECYHRGEGTDSNQISAWVWLTLATETDSPVSQQAQALRETVSHLLTDAQQDRAQILAESLKQILSLQRK